LHPHFRAAINLRKFTSTPSRLETHSLDHGYQLFVFRRPATAGELPKPCPDAKLISQFSFLRIQLSCAKFQFRAGALLGTPTLFHQGKLVAISALTFRCCRKVEDHYFFS
jgi:hypothetical protein